MNNPDPLDTRAFKIQGEGNGNSKLTSEEVLEIRRLWETQNLSQGFIASLFDVSQMQISNIIRRKVWRHLP